MLKNLKEILPAANVGMCAFRVAAQNPGLLQRAHQQHLASGYLDRPSSARCARSSAYLAALFCDVDCCFAGHGQLRSCTTEAALGSTSRLDLLTVWPKDEMGGCRVLALHTHKFWTRLIDRVQGALAQSCSGRRGREQPTHERQHVASSHASHLDNKRAERIEFHCVG